MRIEHGGALDCAIAQFGGELVDWIDLSTGINPEVFPLPSIGAEIWNRLPDEKLQSSAIHAARDYYGATRDAGLIAAPGTQALIQILPDLAAKGEVAILRPTYQEHERSFLQAGWTVLNCQNVDEIPGSAKVTVVVNPNNPDGRIVSKDALLDLAERMYRRGGFLIVDEAFADPHPEVSVAAYAGVKGLIVLKSFGKFFGLGGLRLGFALSTPAVSQALALRLGPWAVSGPALAIATHAFSNGLALSAYMQRLKTRRALLANTLSEAGLVEIGGTMLFSLVRHSQASMLHDALCKRHVLTRKFSYEPRWLRLGLPLDEDAARRLRQDFVIALDSVSS